MMTIKVNLKDNYFVTRINGTLEEIAKYYFSFPGMEIDTIDILEGGSYEDEYTRRTPLKLYRVSEEERETNNLFNNIRYSFQVEYLKGQAENGIMSCGLCRI